MKKFNPVEYNRLKWSDPSHTKHHPQCERGHKYCNLEYEWGVDSSYNDQLINQSLPNVRLPASQEQQNENYELITEENLDDWIGQSINRTVGSMINPQKKFFLPANYEQDLKNRYKSKIKASQYQDQLYFSNMRKDKKSMSSATKQRKTKKIGFNELYVDYKKLQPHYELGGAPIKLREYGHMHKQQTRRRNAVYLDHDVHYTRFLRDTASKDKPVDAKEPKDKLELHINKYQEKEMLYSFNIESMKRKDCYEDVPNSIIQKEFRRVQAVQKDFVNVQSDHAAKQQSIQQWTRERINLQAAQAIQKIEALGKRQPLDNTLAVSSIYFANSSAKPHARSSPQNRRHQQGKGHAHSLQQKVMRLMNNMQVASENIDVQMSRLNIHLAQVQLKHPSDKIQVRWVLKAQEKIAERQNRLAIDCYKQAIIVQPEYFVPIYNIAVLLEKQQMLSYARLWFQLAREFQTDIENVSFGLALVLIKQLRFAEGLKQIDGLISKVQNSKKKVQLEYYYLRALCYKQLERYDEARTDYEIIIKHSKPSNYLSLSNFLLSVVYAKSRRYTIKFNCLSFMNWRESLCLLFYQRPKKVFEDTLTQSELAERLVKTVFFRRFSLNLIKKLLGEANYESVAKDSILFIPKNQSLLVLSGLVSVRCHEKTIAKPETVSVLQQGGVIGAGEIDRNLSSQPNCWYLALTDVQVLRIGRKEFQMFWKGQITFGFDFKYNFLRNVGLFRNLSEAALFKLCECVQRRSYSKSTILFNDGSYRTKIVNREGMGFGLGKLSNTDCRFLNQRKTTNEQQLYRSSKKRRVSKLCQLLKKHIFKFNEMKYNRLKYPGLFIVIDGRVEVESDSGFRCQDIMGERDYFGENLLIPGEGFQNYGRMVVDSPQAQFYVLPVNQMLWAFTKQDKQCMLENVRNRKEIETIRFLHNRFNECQEVKLSNKKLRLERDE